MLATAAAAGGLLVVVLPQLVVVSAEAGRPVLSTSAEFNARLVQPGVAGQPLSFRGLYPPADPDVVTPWERPEDLPVPLVEDLEPGRRPGTRTSTAGRRRRSTGDAGDR